MCLQIELTLFLSFSAKMFKGGKQKESVADMFFNQQDKNKDGYLDRVSFPLISACNRRYNHLMADT